MFKPFIFFLILFALTSCSSTKDYMFDDTSDDEGESLFDLSDPRFDRFRSESESETVAQSEEVSEEEKTEETKKVATSETKSKQEPSISPDQKTLVEDTSEEKEVDTVEEEVVEEEDPYPEEFFEYDKIAKKSWDVFEPNFFRNEEYIFRISYLGLTVGNVLIKTEPIREIAGRPAYHFRAHLRSARYYRMIYRLDDKVETFIDVETFRPVRYSLIQRESGQNVDDLQLFDYDELKTYLFYKRDRDGEIREREEEAHIPSYTLDIFSTLYFTRGLPLKEGEKHRFPVVTRGKIWIIDLEVEEYEEIRIMNEWVEAIPVRAITSIPDEPDQESEGIVFWYSNDSTRRLLKFEANVRLGTVRGELTDYKPGGRKL